MGRLILRLFGTPEVSHAEQPPTFQTRKVLALLAYLFSSFPQENLIE